LRRTGPIVGFRFPPDVDRTVTYQRYYLLGLEERARVRSDGAPLLVRLAPGTTNKMRVAFRLDRGPAQGHVGRYTACMDGRAIRFAIDAHDGPQVRDPEALAWADIYFKANRWPTVEYEAKVLPIVNGNGLLDRRKIRHLRSLRGAEKAVDVAYVSNVWGGREHSLRVFERLAELDCSKDLLAILPAGFPAHEDEANLERLEGRGIAVSREPLPPAELWRRLARARVVPLRAGKHLCFSWRTLDLLCMGACVAFDALPPPRWPVPLEPGNQVADCGIERPEDTQAAPEPEYDKMPAEIERLLAAPGEQAALGREAARYFDEHAAPARVAEWVLSHL
jgi:hypothetical protein